MAIAEDLIQGELGQLLDILPQRVADNLRALENVDEILEVVLDLGRLPEARFPSCDIALDDQDITRADLDNVVERIGDFG
ncbi:MAG: AAA family ATPase, partial [Chloroflexota bacterium]|nr:AAA family ATPase [Chloroflexota bacterium]